VVEGQSPWGPCGFVKGMRDLAGVALHALVVHGIFIKPRSRYWFAASKPDRSLAVSSHFFKQLLQCVALSSLFMKCT